MPKRDGIAATPLAASSAGDDTGRLVASSGVSPRRPIDANTRPSPASPSTPSRPRPARTDRSAPPIQPLAATAGIVAAVDAAGIDRAGEADERARPRRGSAASSPSPGPSPGTGVGPSTSGSLRVSLRRRAQAFVASREACWSCRRRAHRAGSGPPGCAARAPRGRDRSRGRRAARGSPGPRRRRARASSGRMCASPISTIDWLPPFHVNASRPYSL